MTERLPVHSRRLLKILLGLAGMLSVFLLGYAAGLAGISPRLLSQPKTSSASIQVNLLNDVWGILQKRYAGKLDPTAATYGAIQGLIGSLKDPYTVFFTPKEAKDFQNEIQGTFEGIGAEIGIKKNQLVVIAPLPASPAEKAGLVAGDAILTIDGSDSSTLTLDEAVRHIRGKEGTTVKLEVVKNGAKEPTTISIVRSAITIQSVVTKFLDNHLARIDLSYFGPNTAKDFQSAVNDAVVRGAKGVLLDLRSNPGGYLDAAVEVASHFLAKDAVVVIEETADGARSSSTSPREGELINVPTVVLVDQGSASGSEIVAGALQDQGAATLVGVTTFGKGSVQQIEDLPDGSSLKVTVAKWLTPKGRSIHEVGIAPDVQVQRSQEDIDNGRDPQFDRAVQLLLEKTGTTD